MVMIMKLRIDGYSFGEMTVGGKLFTSDLIIHPDGRIKDNWRRVQGHKLLPEDIATVFETAPEKLIIGTGASGQMSVSEGVLDLCSKRGIEVEVCRTTEAVMRFNKAADKDTTIAACFHLTC